MLTIESKCLLTEKRGCSKSKSFFYTLFWGFRKIVQNGQTEQKQGNALLLVPKGVHRYVESRSLFISQSKYLILEICFQTNFFICFSLPFTIMCLYLYHYIGIFFALCALCILPQVFFSIIMYTFLLCRIIYFLRWRNPLFL